MSKTKEFHRPENWSKAHQLLKRADIHTVPLTVGPRPTALVNQRADAFVDLENLHLNYIKLGEDGNVRIGAMATLQDIYQSELIKSQAGGVLTEAAYFSATLGLRNLASLAGTITNPENPPDVPLVLMALDAVVTVQKDENLTRQVALQEWMNDCTKVLLPGEAILEVSFPAQPTALGALVRVNRTPRDKAIVAAVAILQLTNGVCSKAGVSLAGSNPVPVRLQEVETLLTGKSLTTELFVQAGSIAEKQAHPMGDYLGSVTYRTAMAFVLTQRALQQAFKAQK
ncbi:MAG: FAD binding domain-containing protein [Anaerolineaceae bacterium]|nr:FAD binding domain-containing protein [Anaerolineaceae bacterium]